MLKWRRLRELLETFAGQVVTCAGNVETFTGYFNDKGATFTGKVRRLQV